MTNNRGTKPHFPGRTPGSQMRGIKAPTFVWERADAAALLRFDPATKYCTMNCGPHRDDPRSAVECKFLCDECLTLLGA